MKERTKFRSFFRYAISIWDDTDKKEKIFYGLVYGKSFTNAMKKLEAYYGDTILQVKGLYAVGDGDRDFVYEFDNMNYDKNVFTLDVHGT